MFLYVLMVFPIFPWIFTTFPWISPVFRRIFANLEQKVHYPKDIIRKAAAGATKSGNVRDIIYYVWDDLLRNQVR